MGKLTVESRCLYLKEPLRMPEVFEPVRPEIPQRHLAGKRVPRESRRRLREQDLTAVGNVSHPGGAVNVESHQAGRRLRRLATVQAHADPDPLARRPTVLAQRQLHINHGRHAIARRGENSEKPIPRGIDFSPAMSGDSRAEQPVVIGQHVRIDISAEPLEQRRRALDIRE